MPSIILTRPIAQSQHFAAMIPSEVSARADVVISPLLRIKHLDFAKPPSDLDVVFTSENGVSGFAQMAQSEGRRAFCVGDKTALAATQAGFDAISAGGTSRDLVELISQEGRGEVIYARGEHISRDLTAELGAIGIPVHEVVVYTQDALDLSEAAMALIQGSQRMIFPLFSARTMRLLMDHNAFYQRPDVSAVCISPSVADAAQSGVFDEITICQEPTARSMIASLQSVIA